MKERMKMIHKTWDKKETIKRVKCVHTNAKKFVVNNVLTQGKIYDVKNETEEFYFIIDNTGKIGGFKKDYFTEV
jgi:metal-dependent hydrolase (beta-lactamase superfamily II)